GERSGDGSAPRTSRDGKEPHVPRSEGRKSSRDSATAADLDFGRCGHQTERRRRGGGGESREEEGGSDSPLRHEDASHRRHPRNSGANMLSPAGPVARETSPRRGVLDDYDD
ncbi:unnamed protein product, partial [Pylaiella littoralis]